MIMVHVVQVLQADITAAVTSQYEIASGGGGGSDISSTSGTITMPVTG